MKIRITVFILILLCSSSFKWGFYAHKKINRLAVFSLPPEMIAFYKKHIEYISESAINADKRRYAIEEEAPRHYIDIEAYGDSALYKLPRFWNAAVDSLSEDTLNTYGIVPWYVNFVKYKLTEAFRVKDAASILRYSADIGHYIGDAHVPLHTTENYNGQQTGQEGIHGFWESRLPELFAENYDFFVGRADYIEEPQMAIWEVVISSHLAVDSVLTFEYLLNERSASDKKYSFEQRGQQTMKVYSQQYAKSYHELLKGQVERRMRASIKMTADFWYTSWVDAGQPDLDELLGFAFSEEEKEEQKKQEALWRAEEN